MQRDIYVCVSVCVNAHIYTRRLNIALLIKAKNEKNTNSMGESWKNDDVFL